LVLGVHHLGNLIDSIEAALAMEDTLCIDNRILFTPSAFLEVDIDRLWPRILSNFIEVILADL
jgi:hypothetical protein